MTYVGDISRFENSGFFVTNLTLCHGQQRVLRTSHGHVTAPRDLVGSADIPAVEHGIVPRVLKPSFRVLVMPYTQHCGIGGLVYETTDDRPYHDIYICELRTALPFMWGSLGLPPVMLVSCT